MLLAPIGNPEPRGYSPLDTLLFLAAMVSTLSKLGGFHAVKNEKSSTKLAEYMAMHARTIRSIISGILKDDGTGQPLLTDNQKKLPMFMELYGLYRRIKSDLRPLMNTREFADMYAQTIVYGLFIARYNDTTPDSFDRYEAIKYLQEESELLKQFFLCCIVRNLPRTYLVENTIKIALLRNFLSVNQMSFCWMSLISQTRFSTVLSISYLTKVFLQTKITL